MAFLQNILSTNIIRVAVLLTGTALFFSCEERIPVMPDLDIDNLPTLSVKNLHTVHSDSGEVQFVLEAPLVNRYSKGDETYSDFPDGIDVVFYDGNPEPTVYISAGKGRYLEDKKLWELRENVKLRNASNELLETELLYWDENKELVYTDRFVRITGPERRVEGTNFTSDQRFNQWEIKNGTATIYLRDE